MIWLCFYQVTIGSILTASFSVSKNEWTPKQIWSEPKIGVSCPSNYYIISIMFLILAANVAIDTDDTDAEDVPHVTLAEMLDDMHIAEDATGEPGAPMME